VAAPAGGAIVLAGLVQASQHPVQRQVREAVDLEELADLINRAVVRDQLLTGREVDTVKARVPDRRAGDAEMDLLRAGVAEGTHLGARRRSAND